MANEKRLIDANALIRTLDQRDKKNSAYNLIMSVIIGIIDRQPTVDAVEVVRCCDCVSCKVILDNVGAGHWHCKKRYGFPEVDPTDFCSHGERREGECI